jgi:hypothetical protein
MRAVLAASLAALALAAPAVAQDSGGRRPGPAASVEQRRAEFARGRALVSHCGVHVDRVARHMDCATSWQAELAEDRDAPTPTQAFTHGVTLEVFLQAARAGSRYALPQGLGINEAVNRHFGGRLTAYCGAYGLGVECQEVQGHLQGIRREYPVLGHGGRWAQLVD